VTTQDAIGLDNGTVVLTGRALVEASRMISWAVKEMRRRDGVQAPRLIRLDALLRAEALASMSADGPAVRPAAGTAAAFPADVMTTEEVAAAIRISPRHVTRRAHELGGRKVGRHWAFDPVIIAAAAKKGPA
jgi:hypothetical protein